MSAPVDESTDKRTFDEIIGDGKVLRFDTTHVTEEERTEQASYNAMKALLPNKKTFNITPEMLAAEFDEKEFERIFYLKTGVTVLENVYQVSADLLQCIKHPNDKNRMHAVAAKHKKNVQVWSSAVRAILEKPDGPKIAKELMDRHLSDYLNLRRGVAVHLKTAWKHYRQEVSFQQIRLANHGKETTEKIATETPNGKTQSEAAYANLELMHALRKEVEFRQLEVNVSNMMLMLSEALAGTGKFAVLE